MVAKAHRERRQSARCAACGKSPKRCFFKEVLTALHEEGHVVKNKVLLVKTKREMSSRHRRHLRRAAKKKSGRESSEESRGESGESEARF